MERSFKIIIILFLLACSEDPTELPVINDGLTELERQLVGTWQYEKVIVSGREYFFADSQMELGTNRNQLGGNRADLIRRKIVYYSNGTYQLKWSERGDYTLGTEGESNWQPSFGNWQIIGNTLIHNRGFFYETRYTLLFNGSQMTKISDREMTKAHFGAFWLENETVTQTEIFNLID